MTNFDYYPHNLVTAVKGETSQPGGGKVRWLVDSDGILHITHEPGTQDDWQTMTFRLVEVEQKWVEVDEL